MSNKIVTLQNTTKTEGQLPRTVLKAIFDDNGDYLDNQLVASDINALKNGAISSLSGMRNVYINQETTSDLAGGSDSSVILTMPTSTTIYSILIISIQPMTSWDTLAYFYELHSDGECYVHTVGTRTQKYRVTYLVIYDV